MSHKSQAVPLFFFPARPSPSSQHPLPLDPRLVDLDLSARTVDDLDITLQLDGPTEEDVARDLEAAAFDQRWRSLGETALQIIDQLIVAVIQR